MDWDRRRFELIASKSTSQLLRIPADLKTVVEEKVIGQPTGLGDHLLADSIVADVHHHEIALCVRIPGYHLTEAGTVAREAARHRIIGAVLEPLLFRIEDMVPVPVLTAGDELPLVDPRPGEKTESGLLSHRGGLGLPTVKVDHAMSPEAVAAQDGPSTQPRGVKTFEQ